MTIASTARKAGPLLGNGSTTTFPFSFKVFATGDIKVAIANSAGVETALVEGVNYSVSLNANQETSPGGTVTYPIIGSPLPAGSVLSIIGDLDYDQPLDLPSGGNFSPLALENQLDRATMQIQQLKEAVDRSAKLPQTSSQTPDELVFNITRLGESADNIDTVATGIAAVTTVAADIADVNTVAGSIGNVNATGANIAAVVTVANDLNEPVSEINTVAGSIANVDAVGANIASVNAVAGVASDIPTVAGIASDVTIVADNVADVSNFADVYYGPSATNPTLRKDGSPLQGGDLYFNTGTKRLRVFDGTTWVDGPVNAGTITPYSFSGDGTTAAFTLPVDPVSENNTQVYIGGVYQSKSEYSVSGTTLTFNSAPPAGTNNIEVVVITTMAIGATTADMVGATDGASGSLWTTVAGFIAFLLSSLGSSVIGFLQSGAGAVWRSIQDMLRERLSITQFGAVAAAGVDNTTAIQNAINEALASGKALHVPAASVPFEHGALSVPYDPTNTKRLRIVGDHGISYFSNAKTSALKFTGTSGYAITVQGRPGGSGGPNQGSPVSFELGRVAFIGNASCDGALRIARGWFAKIENNAFFGFSKTTGGVVAFDAGDVDSGGTSFAGSSYVENNTFASSGRCIVLTGATGGQVNAMTIRGNKMLDQSYGVVCDFGAGLSYASHVVIEGNQFEGTLESDIYSKGAASNWVIERNYFEQNNSAKNAPRVLIDGASNVNITVQRNTFAKALQAGQPLVRIINARGVSVVNNSSNYGGQTDRYCVDLIACTEATAQVMSYAGGSTPYPVLMNNYNIRTGTVNDEWQKILTPADGFHGISAGDGWPGGTVQTLSATQNKTNGLVTVNIATTITTKSSTSNNVFIGILPLYNYGPDVRFPVFTDNVTGTKPFYGVLANGQAVAQVYDANGTALVYNTAVSVGSKFVAQIQYLTQS